MDTSESLETAFEPLILRVDSAPVALDGNHAVFIATESDEFATIPSTARPTVRD
jgi:hypothetical protein